MGLPGTTSSDQSDAELREMLALMKGSDSVELKLTVPESDHYATIQSLEMDALDAQIRQVFFFDTPDLRLNGAGVVVRARRVQRKGDDTVVKLRPVVPDDLPEDLRELSGFGVEVDAMPGGFVCSGTLKASPRKADVRTTILERGPLRKLFSKRQRALFDEHAPDGIALDDLTVLGPVFVLKVKFAPRGYERRLVAEIWHYPDYSRILELSTKCAPDEAFQVAAEARAFLSERGVSLSGEQQTKTRKALEFFAERAAAGVAEAV
jgi:hypothetical protein